ncbi:MAG: hypothetical protein GY754_28080 [bacterium]|nr:hypothetical protein [bacterium]
MKKISIILRIIFLVYIASFLVYQSLTRPRVLILHSYYTDFSWVRDINTGIDRILKDRPYNIRFHYMDTKRHPQLKFKQKAGVRALEVIEKWQPDVIIALDDNAQQYVSRHLVNKSGVSLLYAGTNEDPSKYGFDRAVNVSGISETMPWDAAKQQLKKLLPPGSKLLHISDDSPSSAAIHREIVNINWAPFKFLESKQIGTFDRWKKIVKDAEGKADCLLITHYHTIREPGDRGKVVKPASVIQWTEANTSLVSIGFWGFFVEDGGMMAVGLSPFEQGEETARMVIEVLEKGRSAGAIRRLKARLHVMYMRRSAFDKRLKGKRVPLELEAFSRALNGYYE